MNIVEIFVNAWGNYNNFGCDGGRWITLPMDADDLKRTLADIAAEMGDTDPEFFINDFSFCVDGLEWSISEHESIFALNDVCASIADLDESGLDILASIIEAYGSDVKEAVSMVDDAVFYSDMSLEDVAYEIVDTCYDLTEFSARYFDYKSFARDLGFEGYTETSKGVVFCA